MRYYDEKALETLGCAVLATAYNDLIDALADMMAIEDPFESSNLNARYAALYEEYQKARNKRKYCSSAETMTVRLSHHYRRKEEEYKRLIQFLDGRQSMAFSGLDTPADFIVELAEEQLALWKADRLNAKYLHIHKFDPAERKEQNA